MKKIKLKGKTVNAVEVNSIDEFYDQIVTGTIVKINGGIVVREVDEIMVDGELKDGEVKYYWFDKELVGHNPSLRVGYQVAIILVHDQAGKHLHVGDMEKKDIFTKTF